MTTPFYEELVAKLTDPMKQKPYKESSVKPLFSYLKNLNGGVTPTSLDFLLHRPIVLPFLEKYKINTQRSIVFAIRNIAKDFKREDILNVWKENIDDTEAGKGLPEPQEKSEAQQKAYALLQTDDKGDAWEIILKKMKKFNEDIEEQQNIVIKPDAPYPPTFEYEGITYTKVDTNNDDLKFGRQRYEDKSKKYRKIDYVVPNLYTMFPPRRNLDYTEMKITTDYKPTLSKDHNYLVIGVEGGKTAMRYVFNRYKTDGAYSQQIFDVPDDLTEVLKRWISATHKKDGDYLLTKIGSGTHAKSKGSKLESDDISDILHRVFGTGISTQMLRHMFVDKYKTPEREKVIHEMMGDAEKMAHSITTQQQVYVKK